MTKTYIISELCGQWGGSMSRAKEMINQSLKEKFESHGLDDDYVASNLKVLVEDKEYITGHILY